MCMNTEDSIQTQDKSLTDVVAKDGYADNEPSQELLGLTDKLVNLEGSRVEVVQEMVDRCKQENVDPEKIRKIVEDKLRARGLSQRTINRAIPDEFKDKRMQEIRSHRLEYVRKEDDTDTDTPVYREPDRVEPRPQWNKDKMDTVQEQSFRTMKVEPNVPVADRQDDYRTIVTNLRLETDNANLDLPVTVRVYDSGKIELMTFTCNQIMLKGDQ